MRSVLNAKYMFHKKITSFLAYAKSYTVLCNLTLCSYRPFILYNNYILNAFLNIENPRIDFEPYIVIPNNTKTAL